MSSMDLFEEFTGAINQFSVTGLSGNPLPADLLIGSEGDIAVYYAPFDHVNRQAKVVIVGITPGLTQARLALESAASGLASDKKPADILRVAKSHASFGGAMRTNLVKLMDYLDIHSILGLGTTLELFESSNNLAHFTSVLRYPVFVNDKNYSGAPDPSRSELLSHELRHFVAEAKQLSSALFVPVGKLPNKVLRNLASNGTVADKNVLFDIPHPVGRKPGTN